MSEEKIDSIKTIQENIKTLNDFMSEALKNGNLAGYGEALKNQASQLEILHRLEAEKPKEPEKPTYQTVFSSKIAESLIIDSGFFGQLERIEQSRKYPDKKVYIFKSTPELKAELDKLISDAKKFKEQRNRENQEIDQAINADKKEDK